MANFNLADYETVDTRIKKFYEEHPDGRITTELVSSEGDAGATRWVVKASVWRHRFADTTLETLAVEPDGTGYAFEVDGQGGMANKTSALENCETSAIGRALANIGYSGAKRPSQEEMRKASADNPQDSAAFDVLANEWAEALTGAKSLADLQAQWEKAGVAGVTADPRVVAAKDKQKAALV